MPKEYVGGQAAHGARLDMLGNRDFLDTPFNMTSYTSKLFENRQPRTLSDVLENDPSVRFTVTRQAGEAPLTSVTCDYTSNAQFGTHIDVGRRFGQDDAFGIRYSGGYRGAKLHIALDAYFNQEIARGGVPMMASFTGTGVAAAPDSSKQYFPRTLWGGRDRAPRWGRRIASSRRARHPNATFFVQMRRHGRRR
ncbi:MAG TPA: hypothetical protein VIF40_10900 [Methylosinus sp.]|uniref:hypothetical protein n=1 Tax=Methylosinus sp. TaxID=427 RepID=UPI002F922091